MLHRGLSPTTPTDAPISSHGAILSSPTPPLCLPTVPFPGPPLGRKCSSPSCLGNSHSSLQV